MRALAPAALVALALAPAAFGAAATGEEVQSLAARAESGDEAALVRLRGIDRVDGRPADLATALDAEGADLRARLGTLAAGETAGPGVAGHPRREAEEILAERRFQGSAVPRPFHGALEWLGERLRTLARPLRWLADVLPGGEAALWAVLSALVVAAAALVAMRLAARRAGRSVPALARGGRGRAPDPARLEREAAEAERRGELERALRLRFRAGLVRLAGAEVIPARESLTSGALRGLVRSPAFDRLALDLDEVLYGGRPASPADVDRARETWPAVLRGAGRS